MKKFIRTAQGFTNYISDNEFVLNDNSYERDELSGRCFILNTPSGFYTKAAREGGLVKQRITNERYNEALIVCKAMLQEAAD
ncbi:MAG: hypothetical protein A2Y17_12170 [Clostridiales bacterium GWF2_38_85]|nr:MAG: hypothetical protein A2Y17_12170 [Clostridiales bacterium GWF2_38_85]